MSDQFPDMSGAYELLAPAKTNLWLRVHGQREDGYHEIETRMVTLQLHDRIRFQWRDDDHVVEPPPTPGLRREGSRGDEKGNS